MTIAPIYPINIRYNLENAVTAVKGYNEKLLPYSI